MTMNSPHRTNGNCSGSQQPSTKSNKFCLHPNKVDRQQIYSEIHSWVHENLSLEKNSEQKQIINVVFESVSSDRQNSHSQETFQERRANEIQKLFKIRYSCKYLLEQVSLEFFRKTVCYFFEVKFLWLFKPNTANQNQTEKLEQKEESQQQQSLNARTKLSLDLKEFLKKFEHQTLCNNHTKQKSEDGKSEKKLCSEVPSLVDSMEPSKRYRFYFDLLTVMCTRMICQFLREYFDEISQDKNLVGEVYVILIHVFTGREVSPKTSEIVMSKFTKASPSSKQNEESSCIIVKDSKSKSTKKNLQKSDSGEGTNKKLELQSLKVRKETRQSSVVSNDDFICNQGRSKVKSKLSKMHSNHSRTDLALESKENLPCLSFQTLKTNGSIQGPDELSVAKSQKIQRNRQRKQEGIMSRIATRQNSIIQLNPQFQIMDSIQEENRVELAEEAVNLFSKKGGNQRLQSKESTHKHCPQMNTLSTSKSLIGLHKSQSSGLLAKHKNSDNEDNLSQQEFIHTVKSSLYVEPLPPVVKKKLNIHHFDKLSEKQNLKAIRKQVLEMEQKVCRAPQQNQMCSGDLSLTMNTFICKDQKGTFDREDQMNSLKSHYGIDLKAIGKKPSSLIKDGIKFSTRQNSAATVNSFRSKKRNRKSFDQAICFLQQNDSGEIGQKLKTMISTISQMRAQDSSEYCGLKVQNSTFAQKSSIQSPSQEVKRSFMPEFANKLPIKASHVTMINQMSSKHYQLTDDINRKSLMSNENGSTNSEGKGVSKRSEVEQGQEKVSKSKGKLSASIVEKDSVKKSKKNFQSSKSKDPDIKQSTTGLKGRNLQYWGDQSLNKRSVQQWKQFIKEMKHTVSQKANVSFSVNGPESLTSRKNTLQKHAYNRTGQQKNYERNPGFQNPLILNSTKDIKHSLQEPKQNCVQKIAKTPTKNSQNHLLDPIHENQTDHSAHSMKINICKQQQLRHDILSSQEAYLDTTHKYNRAEELSNDVLKMMNIHTESQEIHRRSNRMNSFVESNSTSDEYENLGHRVNVGGSSSFSQKKQFKSFGLKKQLETFVGECKLRQEKAKHSIFEIKKKNPNKLQNMEILELLSAQSLSPLSEFQEQNEYQELQINQTTTGLDV